MKEASQVLSKGNFKVKIPIKGKDEIAQLGEAINQLGGSASTGQTHGCAISFKYSTNYTRRL